MSNEANGNSRYENRDYNFSNLLGYHRKKARLAREELAALLGVSLKTIANWEVGRFYPEIDNLKKLTEILITRGSFTAGDEHSEVVKLWEQAHKELDISWLSNLLQKDRTAATIPTSEPPEIVSTTVQNSEPDASNSVKSVADEMILSKLSATTSSAPTSAIQSEINALTSLDEQIEHGIRFKPCSRFNSASRASKNVSNSKKARYFQEVGNFDRYWSRLTGGNSLRHCDSFIFKFPKPCSTKKT